MMKENWMCFPRIGTPEQDNLGVFSFAIGTGAAARSEDRRQTGDAGGVSCAITTINVVRSHHGADKLLRRVVQLIGGFGATEHSKIPRSALADGLFESRGNAAHGFIPCGRTMSAIFPHQRVSKTGR
jgi:hypothetical protein